MSRAPILTELARRACRGVMAALLLALALAVAPAAFAAEDERVIFPGASSKSESSNVSGGSSLNSLTLVVGVALAAVGGWLVWRNRQGVPVGQKMRALSIDETRSLGNRQHLVVASYAGKKFLLGVCPGRISLLSPLQPEADDEDDELPTS